MAKDEWLNSPFPTCLACRGIPTKLAMCPVLCVTSESNQLHNKMPECAPAGRDRERVESSMRNGVVST